MGCDPGHAFLCAAVAKPRFGDPAALPVGEDKGSDLGLNLGYFGHFRAGGDGFAAAAQSTGRAREKCSVRMVGDLWGVYGRRGAAGSSAGV